MTATETVPQLLGGNPAKRETLELSIDPDVVAAAAAVGKRYTRGCHLGVELPNSTAFGPQLLALLPQDS